MEAAEYSFDLQRMLWGDYSWVIYAEIIARVFLILSYTTLIIRWIGKRAVGGIDSGDLLLVIAMGSCVGDAMFYPSIPLLVSIAVISCIGLLQRFYTELGIRFEPVRKAIHPTVVKVVANGKLLEQNLQKDHIDRNEVFMLLRQHGIRYLEEVEAAYYEQTGKLSVFRFEEFQHDTSILPEDLEEVANR